MVKYIKKNKLLILILLLAVFLRFYRINSVPVSMFGDELDVGYHAYSILKTGRDYSGNLFPLQFRSFAEWRTPLFIYSTVPTVAIWGITSFGVRLVPALFGVFGVFLIYLLLSQKDKKIALFASLTLAISPWHIQYSRAAFEVTQMLCFMLLGFYFFYQAYSNKGKYLWLSVVFFILMPWTYNTAKLYTPLVMAILFLFYAKDIFSFEKKRLFRALIAGLILGIPLVFNTFYGGGNARFGYISIFNNPNLEMQISEERSYDINNSRAFHNKLTYYPAAFLKNLSSSVSTDFLLVSGDKNLRHSIPGFGQLHYLELITLLIGIVIFFSSKKIKKREKIVFVLLFIASLIPSALTIDGANHATRLILSLPFYVFLIAFGFKFLSKQKLYLSIYIILLLVNVFFYQHNYYLHYPLQSQRWWHYGWEQAVSYIKEHSADYDRVFITQNDEPPLVFFAAHYQYPPSKWQENFPLDNKIYVEDFGDISYINKFYFASPPAENIYELGKYLLDGDLYLASEQEVKVNLIKEPERTPSDLELLYSVAYPSGEPAFYIFTKK